MTGSDPHPSAPTVALLPPIVVRRELRDALGEIAAGRGLPLEGLVREVLQNVAEAHIRWRRYAAEPPHAPPSGRPVPDRRRARAPQTS